MRLRKMYLPYLIVVTVVMSIYSLFLFHLTKSFGPSPATKIYSSGRSDVWGKGGARSEAEPLPCACTPESVAGLDASRQVVMGLSFPYKHFNSSHWFHISEYYVSRHTHAAPKLPKNATVYIVAPHELFVPNLTPMTFFLLLLAFTDGTARTAEVLPRRALAQVAVAGDVLALDISGVESYVYDSSLSVFQRTRRYQPGERKFQHPRELVAFDPENDGFEAGDLLIGARRSQLAQLAGKSQAPELGNANSADGDRDRRRLRRPLEQGEGERTITVAPNDSLGWPEASVGEIESGSRRGISSSENVSEALLLDNEDGHLGGNKPRSEEKAGAMDDPRPEKTTFLVAENADGADRLANQQFSLREEKPGRVRGGTSDDATGGGSAADSHRISDGTVDPKLADVVSAVGAAISTTTTTTATTATTTVAFTTGIREDPRVLTALSGEEGGGRGEEAEGTEQPDKYAAEFFPLPTVAAAPTTRPCVCARYIGEFGAAPVERGYWFREEKVQDTRARIDALCGNIYQRWRRGESVETLAGGAAGSARESSGMGERGKRRRRLVIYQRDTNRRLLALEDILAVLKGLLGPEWNVVPIVHDNAHEPCWLYSQLMDADMLVTPHGFQSMLLLFLPPGATILEVFPYKYWKEGYAPLAREWGVRHEHVMSRPVSWTKGLALFFIPLNRCMRSIDCRKYSRGADVRLEEHHLRQIAKAAKEASRRKQDFLSLSDPVAPGDARSRR